MGDLAVLTAKRIEAEVIGGGVIVTGAGADEALATGVALGANLARGMPVALCGIVHSLDSDVPPGTLVVATELRAADGTATRPLLAASFVANELRSLGVPVLCGPIVSTTTPPSADEAAGWAADGAIAWDMESAWLARHLSDHPMAVVRVIVDAGRGATMHAQLHGLGPLLELRNSLESWVRASGSHEVHLASPRSFCAGVERAIEIVERALERFGRPVYVRRQIVHNAHVVADLEGKGAVFVEELDQVPDGATVVLAAHGVSPAIRAAAADRPSLTVVDATCPLVAKIHHEARRYLAQDYRIVLIGHAGHEEVEGTLGEAPDRIRLVQRAADVTDLAFAEQDHVAYLTQTTLAVDETADVIDALRQRFRNLVGPTTNDICYASTNRQEAVRSLAHQCDLILVVGSANSSNTARLVEVARREGCRAELIEDASEIRLGWLDDVASIGLTAGASAPESLVTGVIEMLGTLGPTTMTEHRTIEESVQFSLPRQVR